MRVPHLLFHQRIHLIRCKTGAQLIFQNRAVTGAGIFGIQVDLS